jgi:hypothetical protein
MHRVIQIPRQSMRVLEAVLEVVDEIDKHQTHRCAGPGHRHLPRNDTLDHLEQPEPTSYPERTGWDEEEQRRGVCQHLLHFGAAESAGTPQLNDLDCEEGEQHVLEQPSGRAQSGRDIIQKLGQGSNIGATPILQIPPKDER